MLWIFGAAGLVSAPLAARAGDLPLGNVRDSVVAMVEEAAAGVWTRYQWTDARSGEPGTKHTYSKAAAGVIVSVGYVATIS